MKKIKSIITGILPVVVFFMAVQVGMAQEKVQASSDNMGVKGSVDAKDLTKAALQTGIYKYSDVQSVNAENLQHNFTTTMWFQLAVDLLNPTDATTQILQNQGTTNPACSTGETICEVELQYDESDPDIQAELAKVGGSTPPSVSDLIAAGAIYTGPTQFDPVYTYHSE